MAISNQISNINNYIDWNFDKGLDLIEKEINSLQEKINKGNAPTIFSNKVTSLIHLGETSESIHWDYKQSFNPKKAEDIAIDLAAFANTFGGTLGETMLTSR